REPQPQRQLPGAGTSGQRAADVFPLNPGASLLLVTDGVTEARDGSGAFYDPSIRLTPGAYTSPQRLVDALVRDVHRWTGRQSQDDMAVLVLTRPLGSLTSHPDGRAVRLGWINQPG
ncbi:SpoIIE family protein phosphatase, partial [Streptomyces carpinensis]